MAIAALVACVSPAAGETVSYGYDAMGRLTRVESTAGYDVTYQYDLAGNRVRVLTMGGATGVDASCGGTADLDGDGSVTVRDQSLLLGTYGAIAGSMRYTAAADLDCNGCVDLADLRMWYDVFPEGAWLPGDWTSAGTSAGAPWWTRAPDGRVDFWDLTALASEWGPAGAGSRGAKWLDLVSEGGESTLDTRDLSMFESSWRQTSSAPAESADDIQGNRGAADSLQAAGLGVVVRTRDDGAPGSSRIAVEIALEGERVDVVSFQFELGASPGVALANVDAGRTADGVVVRLGAVGPSDAARFLEARARGDATLITGAPLDLQVPAISGRTVLCSIPLARSDRMAELTIRDLRVGFRSGAVVRGPDWSGEVTLDPVPEVPVLLPNRPNPFNPLTTLKFAVPSAMQVGLRVYDLQGRLVRVLVDAVQERGWREVQWDGRTGDGRAVASGVYCYELRVGTDRLTGKMSVIR